MDLVKVANTVLPVPVAESVGQLITDCFNSVSVSITVVDGYKPQTAVRTELRKRLKNKKGIIMTTEQFDSLPSTDFEPPLGREMVNANRNSNEKVVCLPNHVNYDPRITGRIVKFGPKNSITPAVLYYLVHNAGNYGFIHYGPKDPTVWYWRADIQSTYTAEEVVNTFTGELKYLL